MKIDSKSIFFRKENSTHWLIEDIEFCMIDGFKCCGGKLERTFFAADKKCAIWDFEWNEVNLLNGGITKALDHCNSIHFLSSVLTVNVNLSEKVSRNLNENLLLKISEIFSVENFRQ